MFIRKEKTDVLVLPSVFRSAPFTYVLAIKMLVCWIYAHSLFAKDDKRDIKGLRCIMLQLISATFLWENTF